jgi:hypothetical protein
MNKDYKDKRWRIKRETADKLDKYINIQEDQIRNYKNQIEQHKQSYDKLKHELDEYLFILNQNNLLVSKFKKKCFLA